LPLPLRTWAGGYRKEESGTGQTWLRVDACGGRNRSALPAWSTTPVPKQSVNSATPGQGQGPVARWPMPGCIRRKMMAMLAWREIRADGVGLAPARSHQICLSSAFVPAGALIFTNRCFRRTGLHSSAASSRPYRKPSQPRPQNRSPTIWVRLASSGACLSVRKRRGLAMTQRLLSHKPRCPPARPFPWYQAESGFCRGVRPHRVPRACSLLLGWGDRGCRPPGAPARNSALPFWSRD